jgi:electron transport complex protein RnfB
MRAKEEDAYRKLARTLDRIPNGFPATSSGVELRLLARIFEPHEAETASAMHVSAEPASVIAGRLGMAPKAARRILKNMARRGQIRVERGDGELRFALMPFVVGFYEEQLPRIDEEMAELFEQYYQEALGGPLFTESPPIHRVIPVEQSVSLEVDVHPYERASQIVESAKAWGVRDCICRTQQRLVGRGCERLVAGCITLAPVPGAFDYSEVTKAITKDEALRILREAEEAGLVHSTGNYRDGIYYICNCCSCCCGVLRALADHPTPSEVVRSDFVAEVDADSCVACGQCVERCPMSAASISDNVSSIEPGRCIGCGLCAATCAVGAITLQRRKGTPSELPASLDEWMQERARQRGLAYPDER